jgi:hypothetical protein
VEGSRAACTLPPCRCCFFCKGGIGFLVAGGHNFDSLLMALGFMGAFLAYAAGFYLTRDSRPGHGGIAS